MPLITDAIASLKPYEPGKPVEEVQRELGLSDVIKLASNESPYGASPRVREAIENEIGNLHYYPEANAPLLKGALSEFLSVPEDEFIVANGSNELLELLVRTFATDKDHAVISDHAFLVYRMVLTVGRVSVSVCPMTPDFRHDLAAMRAAIRPNTKLVFIANPNNPTGTFNTRAELEAFFDGLREDIVVVLDEAYYEYVTDPTYADGVDLRYLHKNLVAARTFSKAYGLAGVRIGYGVSTKEVIGYLNRVRQPFNTSRLAQVAAVAALEDQAFLSKVVSETTIERARLHQALVERGLSPLPSQTNFVLLQTPQPGSEITNALLHHGVIVRAMDGYGFPNHIRVTVGLPSQNDRFLAALDTVTAAS